jgi:transposase
MTLYIGIDWSEKKHDIVVRNASGAILVQTVIKHSQEGFMELDRMREKLGVRPEECKIGLETSHNLLIDYLWGQGYSQVYVLPPSTVKSLRGRFKVSQAHDDPSDAGLIAELLRVESDSFRPWQPGSALLQTMRAQVNFVGCLTHHSVQLSNRLRSILLRYYPAALEVFSGLGAKITLELIQKYPTPQVSERITWAEFQEFAKLHRYSNRRRLPACFARLQQPRPQADLAIVSAYQAQAVILAKLLLEVEEAKQKTLHDLQQLYCQHPDYSVFHSLPAAGSFLEPALLSKFGEDRQRFPTANSLQVQAGTCPVTQQSGKRKFVSFRRTCDRDFQQLAQQWAKETLRQSLWANAYYLQAVKHSHSKSHAIRCLANRWLAIAWRIWQDGVPYNETYHLQQHALRAQPK